ncbi:hypothetical protein [Helicobacter felis]|uniref:hypothetical protein n=1 Tax=Helicobacter felis TaxID=214 RepID=UPI000CF18019|nr:hypothetical protein [Helicobacter felis]
MESAVAQANLEVMCRDGQNIIKDSFDILQHLQDVADGGVIKACYSLNSACKSESEKVDCRTSLMSPEEIRSTSFEFFSMYLAVQKEHMKDHEHLHNKQKVLSDKEKARLEESLA